MEIRSKVGVNIQTTPNHVGVIANGALNKMELICCSYCGMVLSDREIRDKTCDACPTYRPKTEK